MCYHQGKIIRQSEVFFKDDEYRFNKTIIPVKLVQHGNENLISRFQAKRLLARIELFQIVIPDFSGAKAIGQAFADEVFRVFPKSHPKNDKIG